MGACRRPDLHVNRVAYQYDTAGRLVRETRQGQPSLASGGWFEPATRGYSGDGDRSARAFKLDSAREFAYDGSSQVKSITLTETVRDPNGNARPGIEYTDLASRQDANGGPVFGSEQEALRAGNRDRTRRSDIAKRFSETTNGQEYFRTQSRNVVRSVDYVYDGEGNLIASYQHHPDGTPEQRWLYTYDHRNRLVHATLQRFLARVGELVQFQAVVEVFYRYDAEDHLVHRFEVWTSPPAPQPDLGWQFSAAAKDEYGYPIEAVASGGTGRGDVAWTLREFRFVQDGSSYFGYYEDGGSFTRVVWGAGVDTPVARQSTNTNLWTYGTKWYLTDQQGSVLGLVNATAWDAYEDDPGDANDLRDQLERNVPMGSWAKVVTYGGAGADRRWAPGPAPSLVSRTSHTLHDEIEYAGRYTDYLAALQYNRARWYSPAAGQFLGKDSWGYAAGDTNLYRYAKGSFTNGTDPSGHFLMDVLTTAGLGTAGFLVGYFLGGYDKKGEWDPNRALAMGASGAMVGMGIGMSGSAAFGSVGGIVGSGLISAGLGGLKSQGKVKSGFDGTAWLKGTAAGAGSGLFGGVLGLAASGSGLFGQFAAGYVSNFLTQTINKEMGLQGDHSGAGMVLGGVGSVLGGLLSRVAGAGFQDSMGRVACEATRSVAQRAAYYAAHAAAGGVAGGVSNAAEQWHRGGPFDWGEMWESVGAGAAHSAASAKAHKAMSRACFAGEVPMLLGGGGSQRADQVREGDLLLSRDEHDPTGPVVAKMVEEVFVRTGRIWHLTVGGQLIRTTGEHPVFVVRLGAWAEVSALVEGDLLLGRDGEPVRVEAVYDTGAYETVYNFRIADFHTYFVGADDWKFYVWAHNACTADDVRGYSERNA